jgi:hypothetical protein
MAYTVTGGMKSAGYERRPLIAPVCAVGASDGEAVAVGDGLAGAVVAGTGVLVVVAAVGLVELATCEGRSPNARPIISAAARTAITPPA